MCRPVESYAFMAHDKGVENLFCRYYSGDGKRGSVHFGTGSYELSRHKRYDPASSILHGKNMHLPGCGPITTTKHCHGSVSVHPWLPRHGNLERERPSALEAIYVIWRPAETFPRNLIRHMAVPVPHDVILSGVIRMIVASSWSISPAYWRYFPLILRRHDLAPDAPTSAQSFLCRESRQTRAASNPRHTRR